MAKYDKNRMNWRQASKLLFPLIPLSLIFSLKFNSWCIGLYLLNVLTQEGLPGRVKNLFNAQWLLPFLGFYLIHLVSLFWTEKAEWGIFILEKKAAFLVLPIAIALDGHFDSRVIYRSYLGFICSCGLALLSCLSIAAYQYLLTGKGYFFFYHSLGAPLDLNAVYFSLYLFSALALLLYLYQKEMPAIRKYYKGAIVVAGLFITGLLLLSSKLFIVLLIGLFLVVFLKGSGVFQWGLQKKLIGAALVIGVLFAGIFLLRTPEKRFHDLMTSNFEVLRQDEFHWYTRFNGLTLRLLFLKFGWEIIAHPPAFFFGVGPGDAQGEMLRIKEKYHLYLGNTYLADSGYRGYNFHNQVMETWVQTGLMGVSMLLWLFVGAYRHAIKARHSLSLVLILIALTTFLGSESYLERQRGIVFLVYYFSTLYIFNDYE